MASSCNENRTGDLMERDNGKLFIHIPANCPYLIGTVPNLTKSYVTMCPYFCNNKNLSVVMYRKYMQIPI